MEDRDPQLKKAFAAAERLLKIRPRSEWELRGQLAKKVFPADVVDRVIGEYKRLGIINDDFFARQWVQSRLKRPFGWQRIRFELKQKGVSAETIEQTIEHARAGFDEPATALELARRRAAKYAQLPPDKRKQRVAGFLERRGFDHYAITQALRKL